MGGVAAPPAGRAELPARPPLPRLHAALLRPAAAALPSLAARDAEPKKGRGMETKRERERRMEGNGKERG